MRYPLRIALCLLLLALPASAGVGAWTSLGPDGGPVFGIAVAPDDPDVLYAGTLAGVFKSMDGGATWTLASRGLFLQSAAIYQNAIGPGGVLYTSTGRGVFRTTDGAQTWVSVSNGLPGPAQTLAVDPRSAQRVWAGVGRGRVYLSADGGATWALRRKGLPNGPITQLAVSPDGAWVYAATTRGFYRSPDQGLSWGVGTGIGKQARINEFVIDEGNPASLYAATTGGFYRSRDRGATWNRIAKSVFPSAVNLVTTQGSRLYAAVFNEGIFASSDGGATWAPVPKQPKDLDFTAFAASPDALFPGTFGTRGRPGGVVRSLDHGMSWEEAREGFAALLVSAVAVDPSDPDVLFAAIGRAGAARSLDRGATWEHLDLKIEDPFYYASDVLVDPSDPSNVYVSSLTGLDFQRSEDGGRTWQRIVQAPPFFQLAADRRTPGALWATSYDAVYHSTGSITSWARIPLPEKLTFEELGVLEVNPSDPQVLWIGGAVFAKDGAIRPRLFRSADAGRTWERRDHGIVGKAVTSVAIDPAAPDTLYAATDRGLFRSTDAGRTWSVRPPLVDQVTKVVTTPTAVYAFLAGFGVMRSTDKGATWSPARRDLGAVLVLDLVADPSDPRRLYAGTAARGLFEYTQP